MKKTIVYTILATLVFIALIVSLCCSGNNAGIPSTPLSSVTPLKVQGSLMASGSEKIPEGDDYIAIAGRGVFPLALRANGSIVSWGNDRYSGVPLKMTLLQLPLVAKMMLLSDPTVR